MGRKDEENEVVDWDKIISRTVFKYFNKEFTDDLEISYELYLEGEVKEKRKGDKMKKVMIPLADGLEEIEAITNIDVLRRAGIEVVTVSLAELKVKGDHDIVITADTNIDNINPEDLAGIILPGGMPGASHLKNDKRVIELIREVDTRQGLVAAICAAPIALEEAGVIKGKKATSYPGFGEKMPSCKYQEEKVVVDGNLITGRGPGVAFEFALEVVSYLLNAEKAQELRKGMIVSS